MAPHSGKMSTADETEAANNESSEEVETEVTKEEEKDVASTSGRPCPDVLTITESNDEILLPLTYTTHELRGAIRFLCALGASTAEISRHVKTVYGNATSVYTWCRHFRNGHSSLENVKKSGRPRKVNLDLPEKSAELLDYLRTHRHAGHRDIGYRINYSWAAAYKFIKKSLKYKLFLGCWVPMQLSEENKEERLKFSTVNLARSKRKSEGSGTFINQIVVADQTWVYFHTTPRNKPAPPLKNQDSKVIKTRKNPNRKGKVIKRIQNNRRRWTLETGPSPGFYLLMTVFWDCTSLLAVDFKEPQEPQDSHRYSDRSSLERLSSQVSSIRPELQQTGLTLLMNEDLSSEAMTVVDEAGETITSRLTSFGWQGLFNPANSPDLSPSDYHLFQPLKKHVCRKRFVDTDTAKRYVLEWLLAQDPDFFATGIQELVTRWQRCIELKGDYLDKGLSSTLPAQSVAHIEID